MRIRSLQLTLFVCVTRLAFAGCPTPVMTQAPTLTDPNGPANPLGIVVADFNKDGKIDYAVSDTFSSSVLVYLGNGDGTFAAGVPYAIGGTHGFVSVGADFNGDGFTDIALIVRADDTQYVSVLLNNGDGTFGAAKRDMTPLSSIVFTLKAADMNDDGKMDLVTGGESAQILYGAGDGTFSSSEERFPPGVVWSAVGADLNNDGRTDLIVRYLQWVNGSPTDFLSIYLRGPAGLPQSPTTIYTSRSGDDGDILPIDLDGDGFRDLVATSPADWMVSVYRNNGDGTFAAPIDYSVTTHIFNETVTLIVPADINEDGITDLVFGAMNADDATMMIGNGDGTFQPAFHIPLSAPRYYLAFSGVGVGDVNGDGRPDIFLLESGGSVFFLMNGCTSRYAAVTLDSSANPATYGDSVTITATVTARDGGHATGMLSFFDGATSLGSATLSGATPSTAAVTVPKFALGTHAIVANYSGDATYGASSGKLTQTVNRPTFAIPLDFRASGDPSSDTIALQWIGSTEATSYEVSRMSAGKWDVIGTTASESFTDSNVSALQAYFYRVRARMTGVDPSGYSAPDAATTYVFAHTFTIGGAIFAADMSDLRTCASNLRDAAGVSPMTFTDASLPGVSIKAVHMTELRSALSLAMTRAGMPAPSFSRSIVAGSAVLAADFNELRTMMR